MTTGARSGHVSELQRDSGSVQFKTIAEVLSIGGPSQARDMVEATSMDSTDGFKEFIGGLIDAGEVSMELNCVAGDSEQQALVTNIFAAAGSWRICWPNFDGVSSVAIASVDFGVGVDEITAAAAHRITTGQPIAFTTTDTLPDPLVVGTVYYGREVSATVFTVHPTSADAVAGTSKIDLTDGGTGVHTVYRMVVVSIDLGTDVITLNVHGLKTGQPVRFVTTTTLPAGLALATTYWLRKVSADTFTVHTTNAGAVANTGMVNITGAGTGNHAVDLGSVCEFTAGVSGQEITTPHEGKVTVAAAVKLTGKPTFTW